MSYQVRNSFEVSEIESLIEERDNYMDMRSRVFSFCRELFMLSEISGKTWDSVWMPPKIMAVDPDTIYVSGLYDGMVKITFLSERCDYSEDYAFPTSFLGDLKGGLEVYRLALGMGE